MLNDDRVVRRGLHARHRTGAKRAKRASLRTATHAPETCKMALAWPMPFAMRPLPERRRCTAPLALPLRRASAAHAARLATLRRPQAGGFSGWGDLADGNTEGVQDAVPKRPRQAVDAAPRRSAPREQSGFGRERGEGGLGRERSFSGRQEMRSRPGDWKCPGCGGDNFASRTQCYRCGNDSPTPGRPLVAVKREVQVRPGDWSCPECSALVFASRTECFRCKVRCCSAARLWAVQLTPPGPQAPRGERQVLGPGDVFGEVAYFTEVPKADENALMAAIALNPISLSVDA